MSKTYILFPNQKHADGTVFDIVTTQWETDRSWVVGERLPNGSITFNHRSFPSLNAVCIAKGLTLSDVKKRVVPESGETAKAAPAVRYGELKLKAAKRLALIGDVSDVAYSSTESFKEQNIGTDLAYLLAAIAKNSGVDWRKKTSPDQPHLLTIFRNALPVSHPVWSFIML